MQLTPFPARRTVAWARGPAGEEMTNPKGRDTRRCPECGVDSRVGSKYCEFCGRQLPAAVEPRASETRQAQLRLQTAKRIFIGIAVACLVIGVLVFVGRRLGEREPPPPASPSLPDAKRQAAAACEVALRQQARGPFRGISFRSTLVAEELGGYVVSGSVELQSVAGEVQLRRYSCRFHSDLQAGMVLDDGIIY